MRVPARAAKNQQTETLEVIETEPGLYRRAEITGYSYKVFTLTALMP